MCAVDIYDFFALHFWKEKLEIKSSSIAKYIETTFLGRFKMFNFKRMWMNNEHYINYSQKRRTCIFQCLLFGKRTKKIRNTKRSSWNNHLLLNS